ncbi:hypothetical protein VYU27_004557 [Nannochloropsis oceanica]
MPLTTTSSSINRSIPVATQGHAEATAVIDIHNVIGDLPVRAGKEFVVTVHATPNAVLDGGVIYMVVKALGVSVSSHSFNICKDIGLECPVVPQQKITAVFHFPVPWYAITMKADVVITATDKLGQSLACVLAPQVPVVRKGYEDPVLPEVVAGELSPTQEGERQIDGRGTDLGDDYDVYAGRSCGDGGGKFVSASKGLWALVCE